MRGEHEIEKLGEIIQAAPQIFPIINARLDELRETVKLHAADRGLNIERFEIIPEVRIDVFMIVALRQFAELPIESFATSVVLAAGAPTIAAPISETFNDRLEF